MSTNAAMWKCCCRPSTTRTFTSKGKDADVVDVLFVGSREDMDSAFRAAGWLNNDHNSAHSVLRQFQAFLTLSNYPTAPVSTQYLNGRPQDVTWQKSFDSYGKRDHVRLVAGIWHRSWPGSLARRICPRDQRGAFRHQSQVHPPRGPEY